MRNLYSFVFVLLAIVFIPISVNAQIFGSYFTSLLDTDYDSISITNGSFFTTALDYNSTGGGARAAGMGGAYTALAEGETAYSWNPAAMIYTDKTKFGIQFLSQSDTFSDVFIDYDIEYAETANRQFDLNRDHVNLNFGGFAAPFIFKDRNWVVGGGYRNVIDLTAKTSFDSFGSSKYNYSQNKSIDAATLGLAYELTNNIGVGFNINAYIRGTESNFYIGKGWIEILENGDSIYADVQINNKSTFNGFNLDIGISGNFGMFKGGAVIHTPFKLEEKNTLTQTPLFPFQSYGFIFRRVITYEFPLSYSFGLAITPMESFTFAFDFDMKDPISKIKTDWQSNYVIDTEFEPEWESLSQFRIGAEYIFNTSFADLPIRLGYRNEPSPYKEIILVTADEYGFGDQIVTNIYTFGTGLYFDKIWFDMAYQFGSYSYDRVIDLAEENTYEIKRDYSKLLCSVGVYF